MIAHIDADAFFASVLQRKYPKLRGKPLLALGMGGGCVIAASYEAKAKGVKTGMRLSEAKILVPDAVTHPSDFKEACMASRELESILRDLSPLVEKMSVDEWFVDLRSIPGGIPPLKTLWAENVRECMKRKTHLSVSIGIGPTKLLAKMASEYRKPAGITVLGCDETKGEIRIEDFLKDRPVAAIPGIGRKRSVQAMEQRWQSAFEFAAAEVEAVRSCFGKSGIDLHKELNGTVASSVREDDRPPQSVSRCRSFRRTRDVRHICAHLLDHLAYCVIKLRRWNLCCSSIQVWVRDGTFASYGKTVRLPKPVDTEDALLPYVTSCFRSLTDSHASWTQVGLGLHDVSALGGTQYSLFEPAEKTIKTESIQRAMDELHERFGRGTLMRGAALVEGKKGPRNELYVTN